MARWLKAVLGGLWDAAGVVDDSWGRAKVIGAAVLCVGGLILLAGFLKTVLFVIGLVCVLVGGITLAVAWRKAPRVVEGRELDPSVKREAVEKILSELIWKAPVAAARNNMGAVQAWKSAAHGVIDLAFGPLETAKFEQVAMDQVFRDEPMDPPKIIVERYAAKLNDLVARIHSVPLKSNFDPALLEPFHEQVANL